MRAKPKHLLTPENLHGCQVNQGQQLRCWQSKCEECSKGDLAATNNAMQDAHNARCASAMACHCRHS